MRRRLALSLAFAPVLAGCNPHSADAEGEFTAFLSVSSSRTLFKETLDLDGYTGDGASHTQIDCRDPDDVAILPDADPAICAGIADFEHERWMEFDGFEVLTLPIEPWRGEAIITSEGDVQLTFHNHLPGEADFRFAIVVDPKFQPTQCDVGPDGEGVRNPVDGDWITSWSADLATWDPPATGSLFYLNQGAFQFNPSNTEDIWPLPERWLAGSAFAKYGEEDFAIIPTRYGYPSAYEAYEVDEFSLPDREDLFYAGIDEGSDPATNANYQALKAETQSVADAINSEFALALGEGKVTVRSTANEWRAPKGDAAGIDNWTELNYNWVRFDQPQQDLAVGSPATGEFHLIMKSTDSPSRLVLRGTFTVDKIKQDHWTLPNLTPEKLEEYGTELCGGAQTF